MSGDPPTQQEADAAGGLRAVAYRYLPILAWLPGYDRSWLVPDAVAAVAVWALLVPQAMGYAQVAGVPAEAGLYAPAPSFTALHDRLPQAKQSRQHQHDTHQHRERRR